LRLPRPQVPRLWRLWRGGSRQARALRRRWRRRSLPKLSEVPLYAGTEEAPAAAAGVEAVEEAKVEGGESAEAEVEEAAPGAEAVEAGDYTMS